MDALKPFPTANRPEDHVLALLIHRPQATLHVFWQVFARAKRPQKRAPQYALTDIEKGVVAKFLHHDPQAPQAQATLSHQSKNNNTLTSLHHRAESDVICRTKKRETIRPTEGRQLHRS